MQSAVAEAQDQKTLTTPVPEAVVDRTPQGEIAQRQGERDDHQRDLRSADRSDSVSHAPTNQAQSSSATTNLAADKATSIVNEPTAAKPTEPLNKDALFAKVEELAAKHAFTDLNPSEAAEQIKAQFKADMAEIWKDHGDHIGKDLLNEIKDRWVSTREMTRQDAMLYELRELGRSQAATNFRDNPAKGPNAESIQRDINAIQQKYGDVMTPEKQAGLQKKMIEQYRSAYSVEHNQLFDSELNWAQKAYYGAREMVSGAWDKITAASAVAVRGAVGLVKGVQALDQAVNELVGEAANRVATTLVRAKDYAAEALTDLKDGTLQLAAKSGTAVVGLGIAAASTVAYIGQHPGQALAAVGSGLAGLGRGALALGQGALELGRDAVSATIDVAAKGISAGADLAVNAATAAARGTWYAITHPVETAKAVYNVAEKVVVGTYKVGEAVVKGAYNAGAAVVSGVAWVVTHPVEAAQAVGKAAVAVGRAGLNAATAVGNFAVDIVRNPEKAWETAKSVGKSVGNFAYGMAESIGIVDFAKGTWGAVTGLAQTAYQLSTDMGRVIATGGSPESLQALKENFKNNVTTTANSAWTGVKGLARGVGEVTGINDLGRAGIALYNGNYAEAGMHLAFAAGSVVGLATLGSGTAVVLGLKQAAKQATVMAVKEGAEVLAKGAGKEVAEYIAKEIGQETIEKTGQAIGKESIQILEKNVAEIVAKIPVGEAREAALKQASEQVVKEVTEKNVANMLREAGVDQKVKEVVLERLKDIGSASRSELSSQLQEAGLKKELADKTAKEMHKAIRSGKLDDVMKEGFEKQMVAEVMTELKKDMLPKMEKAFKSEFDEGLQALAKKHGLNEAEQRAMREGAEKGFREGFEAGVRRVVREGINKAFDEYRKRDSRSNEDYSFKKRPEEIRRSTDENFKLSRYEIGESEQNRFGDMKVIYDKRRDEITKIEVNLTPEQIKKQEAVVPGGTILFAGNNPFKPAEVRIDSSYKAITPAADEAPASFKISDYRADGKKSGRIAA